VISTPASAKVRMMAAEIAGTGAPYLGFVGQLLLLKGGDELLDREIGEGLLQASCRWRVRLSPVGAGDHRGGGIFESKTPIMCRRSTGVTLCD
jgi:hypothetical protein